MGKIMVNFGLGKAARMVAAFMVFVVAAASSASAQSMFRKANDFDGDLKADYAIARVENGAMVWHVWRSSAGYMGVQWGLPFTTDRPAAADYDGDGKTDIAVTRLPDPNSRPMIFDTYVLSSQTNSLLMRRVSSWTCTFVAPQDYDGDGKADATCGMVEGENMFIYRSSQTGDQWPIRTQTGSTIVRAGDLTGDGRAELATRGPSSRLFIRDLATGVDRITEWGASGDEYVAADFDGDGKGEIAIFRPSAGEWWWIRSSDNVVNAARWGLNGDRPVPADYDGDGKTDLAIWRPGSQSHFWINRSLGGVTVFQWGTSTDSVVGY